MATLSFYTVSFGIDESHFILKNRPLAERFGMTVFSDCDLDLPACFSLRKVSGKHPNPRISSRYWKILSFSEFDTSHSVYVDANLQINTDRLEPLFDRAESGTQVGVFEHNRKRRVIHEIFYCYAVGKLSASELFALLRFLPRWHLPVFQGGVILRPTKDLQVEIAMQKWWDLVTAYSERDQITGPLAMRSTGIDWQCTMFDGAIHNSEFSNVIPHRLKNYAPTGSVRSGDPLQRMIERVLSR